MSAVLQKLNAEDPAIRRRAIITAVKQGDRSVLDALHGLAQGDPDPELRALAQRAIETLELRTPSDDDPLGLNAAEHDFMQALRLYKAERYAEVAEPLTRALHRDPTLHTDEAARMMAARVTGKAPNKAVQALLDGRIAAKPKARSGRWKRRRGRQRSVIGLVFVSSILALMIAAFINSGALDLYLGSLRMDSWRAYLQTDGPYDYYAIVPEGDPPPQGWPMLLALHNHGSRAEALLAEFAPLAQEEKILLVAPSFGEYPAPHSDFATPAIDAILNEVRSAHPVDPRGVVVFGFGMGGEIATLYAQEYYRVAAVITGSASYLYEPPSNERLPYVFVYNHGEEMIPFHRRFADALISQGQRVEFRVVDGGRPYTLSEGQVFLTMTLVDAVFDN